ncbi:MAG: TRAP transporter small permease [Pseudomonadota bacterium]
MTLSGRILDGVSGVLFVVAGLSLAAMALFYLYEVAARYLFGAPTIWTADAVGYTLAAVIFAALPEATRRRSHVAVDVVPSALGPAAARALTRLTDGAAALACGAAGSIAAREALRQFERGLMTNAAIPVPRWPITAMIALGLLVAALQLARHAARPPQGERP